MGQLRRSWANICYRPTRLELNSSCDPGSACGRSEAGTLKERYILKAVLDPLKSSPHPSLNTCCGNMKAVQQTYAYNSWLIGTGTVHIQRALSSSPTPNA